MKMIGEPRRDTDEHGPFVSHAAEHGDMRVFVTDRGGKFSASVEKKGGGGYSSVLNTDPVGLVEFFLNIFGKR